MQRIVYLSAVAGQKTGTADYLDIFLDECRLPQPDLNQIIVCDFAISDPLAKSIHGIPIIDYSSYSWKYDDIVVCFIANNKFHAFVLDFLLRCPKEAKVISVIHDPQIFMITETICTNNWFNISLRTFADFIKNECAVSAREIIPLLTARCVPEILKYTLCCQSITLEKSSKILVHSHYARLKLILEHNESTKMPPIYVGAHPIRKRLLPEIKTKIFTVGCFGWITSAKRPVQVIRAFAEFVRNLYCEEQKLVELKFVGQLTQKCLSPVKLAKEAEISDRVRHLGFLSSDEYKKEIDSTNLIINLRYPSCGETSGTLHDGIEAGRIAVLSDYQSFSEEPAKYHLSIMAEDERSDLVAILHKEFKNWQNHQVEKEEIRIGSNKLSTASICKVMLSKFLQS